MVKFFRTGTDIGITHLKNRRKSVIFVEELMLYVDVSNGLQIKM